MKRRFSAGLAVLAALGSTSLAPAGFAQTAPTPPPQSSAAPQPAIPDSGNLNPSKGDKKTDKADDSFRAFFDAKLAGVRAGLELTPDQAPLWTPVESAIRDLAKVRTGGRAAREGDGDAEGLDQLKRSSERMIRVGQAIKALADATGPLLATLGADQKERLPRLIDGLQPRGILAKAFNVRADDERRTGRDGRRRDEGGEPHAWRRSFQDRDRGYGGERDYGRGREDEREDDRTGALGDGDDHWRRDGGQRGRAFSGHRRCDEDDLCDRELRRRDDRRRPVEEEDERT